MTALTPKLWMTGIVSIFIMFAIHSVPFGWAGVTAGKPKQLKVNEPFFEQAQLELKSTPSVSTEVKPKKKKSLSPMKCGGM